VGAGWYISASIIPAEAEKDAADAGREWGRKEMRDG
jgi:hypothetical protein